jgi:hypothetical protein
VKCCYRSSHSATDIININIILTIEKTTTVGNEKLSRQFKTKSVPGSGKKVCLDLLSVMINLASGFTTLNLKSGSETTG